MAVTAQQPQLWWPRGRGEPSLYTVDIWLLKHGQPIDHKTIKHGIRSITLERSDWTDKEGTGQFQFLVNHEPVFIHGTNWVPVDVYHSRDAARIPQILSLVDDLGCNMIRCWGGNVYEDDLSSTCATKKAFWSGRTSPWPAPSTRKTMSSANGSGWKRGLSSSGSGSMPVWRFGPGTTNVTKRSSCLRCLLTHRKTS